MTFYISEDPVYNSEFHPTLNEPLKSSQVSLKSTKKIWWRCPAGHDWQAIVLNRTRRNQLCPVCAGKKLLTGYNDLRTVNPELASEWSKKNAITPDSVLPTLNKKVWWECDKGHEWEALVYARAITKRGCPYCAGRKAVPGGNDLKTVDPHLASQWHPTKNILTPEEVTSGSKKKVWWQCEKGHEWEATIANRRMGRGCPVCAGKVVTLDNSIATSEDLSELWHNLKNTTSPTNVALNSHKLFWWQCAKGHQWQDTPANMTSRKNKCHFCSGRLPVVGTSDLQTLYPQLASEWSADNDTNPTEHAPGSSAIIWWECEHGHKWKKAIKSRVRYNLGCPACANHVVIPGVNDLLSQYPELASQWGKQNSPLEPSEVYAKSTKKVWWECEKGHEWNETVYKRVVRGYGCPYCSGHRVMTGYNDLSTTSPEVASRWDTKANGDLLPTEVSEGSQIKVWWKGECGHCWERSIVAETSSTGCPTCMPGIRSQRRVKAVLDKKGSLLQEYPTIAADWHSTKNGTLTPGEVLSSSGLNIWWQCSVNSSHEWCTAVHNRTSQGTGCPRCASSGPSKKEQEVADYLVELLKEAGVQVVTSSRKVIPPHEVDIYIPEKNLAVEFNGVYWHSEANGKDSKYHFNKWKACKDKGIQLIQIWEDDWNRNPELVKSMLAHKLGVTTGGVVYARNTRFVEVRHPEAENFLEKNHLQGSRYAKHYGLKTSSGELVAILSMTKKKDNTAEIARFATGKAVPGGFSKLLNGWLKLNPDVTKVISYSHNDYSDGGVYKANGFSVIHEGTPGYSYLVGNVRVNRLSYTKKRFKEDPDLEYQDGLTERQLAALNGLIRVWDSGSSLWQKLV